MTDPIQSQVDWIDAGVCADYLFPPPGTTTESLDALANTTYSACTLAEHATETTHCQNKDIVYGDGSQWCHDSAHNRSSYDIKVAIWYRLCTWVPSDRGIPPLCNAPLSIFQNVNATCTHHHCHVDVTAA